MPSRERGPAGDPEHARHRRPVDVGVEHPDRAARWPAAPSARLAATVDLPTPPLPEATATIARTPGTAPRAVRRRRSGRRRRARLRLRGAARGGACAVSTAVTESTPGSASTAFSAALRNGSSRGPRSARPRSQRRHCRRGSTSPETIPSETMSAPLSGSATRPSASRICRSVTVLIPFSSPAWQHSTDRSWRLVPERRLRQTERSSKPVAGSREDCSVVVTGPWRRRICGIWDRRPDLTTPAPRSLSGRASRAPQPWDGVERTSGIPSGIAERFELDVLAKSGRWPLGQRAARRRPVGRQPRQRRRRARAGAARSRPTSRSCCGAARTAFGGCCRAVSATGTGIAIVVARDRRHLAGERLLPRAARRGRRRAALRRL